MDEEMNLKIINGEEKIEISTKISRIFTKEMLLKMRSEFQEKLDFIDAALSKFTI